MFCGTNAVEKHRIYVLVGGFNPFEKYSSKWESSPNRDDNKIYLKPLPSVSYVSKNGDLPESKQVRRVSFKIFQAFM